MRRRLDIANEFDGRLAPRRILREHHPHPAAGAGRSRVRARLRDRRDIPLRELGRREPGLEILQLPVAAEEHRRVAGDGGAGHLLVVGLRQHRSRRRAALNRVAQESQHAQHRAAIRLDAENRPAVVIDELATLRPEHREVIEDRAFPASGVVEIARHLLLARDPAGDVEQLRPRPGRSRHEILAVEEHAAVGLVPQAKHVTRGIRQRLDRERQEVGAILRRPILFQRLHFVRKQRQPVAVDRGEVGQPARRGGKLQLGFVQLEAGHHRNMKLDAGMRLRPVGEDAGERVRDRRTSGEMKVVGLCPDAERQRRIGAPDAYRRHEIVLCLRGH